MIRNYTINLTQKHITGTLSCSHGPAGDIISFSFFFFFFLIPGRFPRWRVWDIRSTWKNNYVTKSVMYEVQLGFT